MGKRIPMPNDPKHKRVPREDNDRAYLEWVGKHLCCVVTLSREFVIHHLRWDSQGPIGTGHNDDRWVLPLAPNLHDNEPNSLHKMGERKFFAVHNPEYITLSAMIRCAYEMDSPEMAQTAIINALRRTA